jgi:hypothetical protein
MESAIPEDVISRLNNVYFYLGREGGDMADNEQKHELVPAQPQETKQREAKQEETVTRVYEIGGVRYVETQEFGCQLVSWERKRPQVTINNGRQILGEKFVPLHSERSGLLQYRVFWCLESVRNDQGTKDQQNKTVQKFIHKLRNS